MSVNFCTAQPIMTFKQAVEELILNYENGQRHLEGGMGLCLKISRMMYGENYPFVIYDVTSLLLTPEEFHNALGEPGVFSVERYLKLKEWKNLSYKKYMMAVKNAKDANPQDQVLTKEHFG